MRSASVFLALALLAGCSGKSADTDPPDGGGAGAGGGQGATCATEAAAAASFMTSQSPGWSSLACSVDSDCTLGASAPSCMPQGCGGTLLTTASASAFGAAIAHADTAICTSACTQPAPPCAVPPGGGPACVSGTCTADFPVAAWTSLAITELPNAENECADGGPCTSWTVTPDGGLTITAVGGPAQTLSATDLATVSGILESVPFRSALPTCPAAAAGSMPVQMSVQRPDFSQYAADITGCVQAAGASDAKTLYDVVTSYGP